jgi:hypothetical protein
MSLSVFVQLTSKLGFYVMHTGFTRETSSRLPLGSAKDLTRYKIFTIAFENYSKTQNGSKRGPRVAGNCFHFSNFAGTFFRNQILTACRFNFLALSEILRRPSANPLLEVGAS